jgi:DNA-binding NtrC family response regulator
MTKTARILVIDDDELVNEYIQEALKRMGHQVRTATSAEEGLRLTEAESFDLVFTDVKMPGASGLDVLQRVKARFPETLVVLVTAFGDVEMAVEAMKSGAYEFMLKPCSPEQIEMVTLRALEFSRLRTENRMLREQQSQGGSRYQLVGRSVRMKEVEHVMKQAAPHATRVLITGESGTGKELVARSIHYASTRSEAPWITFNCAAVPEQLAESELFGHEKGAFTGAHKTTRGRFEVADTGTLLLDEIGEMKLDLQAKLLRVLQEREIERVGSTDPIPVDVRIIATTNRNLEDEVAAGNFREDLFHRLNVIPIHVPPLRDRREDISLLVEHYLKLFAAETGKDVVGLEESAMRMLQEYHWPGNVRELANAMERAVVLTGHRKLKRDDFPMSFRMGGQHSRSLDADDDLNVKTMERRLIIKALERTGGNRKKSAELLGIAIRTLRNKINDYGLKSDGPDADEPEDADSAATEESDLVSDVTA